MPNACPTRRQVTCGASLAHAMRPHARGPGPGASRVKAAILGAATQVLTDHGVEALSLRAIADVAGIGVTSIYHYFSSKAEILVDLASLGFRDLELDIQKRQQDAPSPMEGGAQAFFDFVRDRPTLFLLMFDEHLMSRSAVVREAEQAAFLAYAAAVRAGGRIPEEIQDDVALALWALGRGAAAIMSSYPDGAMPEEAFTRLLAGANYLIERGLPPTRGFALAPRTDALDASIGVLSFATGDEAGRPSGQGRRVLSPIIRLTPVANSLQSRVVSAALTVLETEGPDRLSLRTIALRAGVGLGSIYYYLPSKQDLLRRLALSGLGDLLDQVRRSITADGGLGPMRASHKAYNAFVRARPALFSLMFNPGLLSQHAQLRVAEGKVFDTYRAAVRAEGRIPIELQDSATLAIWALGRGQASMMTSYGGALPVELEKRLARGAAFLIDRRA